MSFNRRSFGAALVVALVWKVVAALAWLVAQLTFVWRFENPNSLPVFVIVEVPNRWTM